MRPPWVSTLFFNNVTRNFGFSENYYPIGPDQATAQAAVATLLGNRLALMSNEWEVVYGRLDVPGSPRDSVPITLPGTRTGTYPIISPALELPADSAVLITLFGSPTQKNRHFFRVISSADMDTPNHFHPTNAWLTLFATYSVTLAGSFYVARNTVATNYFTALISVNVGGFTNRKMGRPFGVPRGRRR
jgi:hypothetical protein